MDSSNSQDQIIEYAELGPFLEEIALKLISKGESLRGIGQLWFETDSEEFQILANLSLEISQCGRNLKLLENCLCNSCQMRSIETSIFVGKAEGR